MSPGPVAFSLYQWRSRLVLEMSAQQLWPIIAKGVATKSTPTQIGSVINPTVMSMYMPAVLSLKPIKRLQQSCGQALNGRKLRQEQLIFFDSRCCHNNYEYYK